MKNKIIVFLIRKRLHLKRNELFKFRGQHRPGVYYFSNDRLIKVINNKKILSSVSFNYLMSPRCRVYKVK